MILKYNISHVLSLSFPLFSVFDTQDNCTGIMSEMSYTSVGGAELQLPCERIIKGGKALHPLEQSSARKEQVSVESHTEWSGAHHFLPLLFFLTPISPFLSPSLDQCSWKTCWWPCSSLCVCVCVFVKSNGCATNSLADTTGSVLIALPRKVHVGCKCYRAVMRDLIHFIVWLYPPCLQSGPCKFHWLNCTVTKYIY